MARKRASMREGPLAELFKATEAAQRQAEQQQEAPADQKHEEPQEATVEHVPASANKTVRLAWHEDDLQALARAAGITEAHVRVLLGDHDDEGDTDAG